MGRRVALALGAWGVFGGFAACTLTTDFDSLTGGANGGASDGAPGGRLDGPSCGVGLLCAPAPPPGWKFATVSAPAEPGCPPGYSTPQDIFENAVGAPASCACECPDASSGRCAFPDAGAVLQTGAGGACDGTSYPAGAIFGGCEAFAVSVANGGGVALTAATTEQQACDIGAKVRVTREPADASAARLCAVEVDPLAGTCPTGSVCARDVPSPFTICVEQMSGDAGAGCPDGYPNAHLYGTQVVDTRGCSPSCSCSTTTECGGVTLRLGKTSCTPSLDIPADGTCRAASSTGNFGYLSWTVVSPPPGPCVPTSTPAPMGAVSAVPAHRVCCP